jgi:hypothetical protein
MKVQTKKEEKAEVSLSEITSALKVYTSIKV